MIQPPQVSDESEMERLAPLGRALFGAGILLLVCRGLTLTTRMSGLPAFWYANQPLWVAVGLGLTGLGWRILWRNPQRVAPTWQPSLPGRRFHSATVYVSEGCHLCEDAMAILAGYKRWLPVIEQVDVRCDPTLVERFSTCVPVVVLDGKVRFRGKVDENLLRRLIEGTPSLAAATEGTGQNKNRDS